MNQELLYEVVENLNKVSDYLYQENIPVANQMLFLVLPKLERCISEIANEEIQDTLKEKLAEALTAMEEEDFILLADLIQYEVIEILKELME
ncbi:MAG: hypothetical protein ACI4F4_06245 [Lachnospiraceae bacterium]